MGKREAGTIFISLQLATAKFQSGIATIEKQLNRFGRNAQRAGDQLSRAFTLPVAAMAAGAVKSFASFDKAMTQSVAVMGDVSQTMREDLAKGALAVSKQFTFSATQAAQAYFALGQAGYTASQALGALPTVATMATAGQFDLARASQYLVDIQGALGLSSQDAAENMQHLSRISDVLTRASLDTQVSVEDLATSMASKLGGAMRLAGVSIETGAAALESFGSQGIKGAAAGTALGIVIRELQTKAVKNAAAFKANGIAVFDAAGNFRNLIDIIQNLEERTTGLTDKQFTLFTQQLGFTDKNRQFLQALIGTSEKMKEWEKRNLAVGTSAEIAKKHLQNFSDQMAILKNRVVAVAISVGADLAPGVAAIAEGFTQLIEGFQKLDPETRKMIEWTAVILAAAGPVVLGLRLIVGGILGLVGAVKLVGTVLAGVAGFVGTAIAAVGLFPVAVTAATVAAAATVYSYWDNITQKASDYIEWFKTNYPKTATLVEAVTLKMGDYYDSFIKVATRGFEDFSAVLTTWAEQTANAMKGFFDALWDSIKAGFNAIKPGEMVEQGFSNAKIGNPDALPKGPNLVGAVNEWAKATVQSHVVADEMTRFSKNATLALSAIKPMVPTFEEVLKLSHETANGVGGIEEKGKKAASALKELHQQFVSEKNQTTLQALQDQIDKAIESGNQVQFIGLRDKLVEAIKSGTLEGLADKVKEAGPEGAKLAAQIAEQNAAQAAEKYTEKMREASIANAKKVSEDLKQAHEEAVSYYGDLFDRLFTGGEIDFKGMFREMLSGFAAELSASIFGGVADGVKSVKGMGQFLAASIFGSNGQGGSGTLAGLLGIGQSANSLINAQGASVVAPEGAIGQNADGTFIVPGQSAGVAGTPKPSNAGFVQGGLVVAGSIFGSNKANKDSNSEAGTGGAVGSAGGMAIGAAIGGPGGAAIGAQIGQIVGSAIGGMFKHGSQNPETKARHAFAGWIEDSLQKLSSVAFFDDGKLKVSNGKNFNFLEGDTGRFNSPDWGAKLDAMGDQARTTWLGLGEALKEVAGITEDVGGQIGFLLAEQFGSNVDNARLLVMQLGVSLEDLTEKLVATGLKGSKTWLEVEVGIQGVNEAFRPGLVAIGDVAGAWDELVASGGRGVAALKGVRDVAIETLEKQGVSLQRIHELETQAADSSNANAQKSAQAELTRLNSLELLKQELLASGVAAEDVQALMQSLADRGVTTLSQLAEASDRTAGSIVAGLNAGSEALTDKWKSMTDELENVAEKLKNIPEQVTSSITLDVSANISDDARTVLNSGAAPDISGVTNSVRKFAKGGVLRRATSFGLGGANLGLAGEAGPEALIPLAPMSNGALGVRMIDTGRNKGNGGTTIVVNAPNATPGMEQRIVRAIVEMGDAAVARAVDTVNRSAIRGGRSGVSF